MVAFLVYPTEIYSSSKIKFDLFGDNFLLCSWLVDSFINVVYNAWKMSIAVDVQDIGAALSISLHRLRRIHSLPGLLQITECIMVSLSNWINSAP